MLPTDKQQGEKGENKWGCEMPEDRDRDGSLLVNPVSRNVMRQSGMDCVSLAELLVMLLRSSPTGDIS